MLPHFPKAKRAMDNSFHRLMLDALWKAAPILHQIRSHAVVEGDSSSYEQEDGTIVETDGQLSRVEYSIKYENAKGLMPDEFLDHAEELGSKMGRQMETQFFEFMSRVTDSTGNTVAIGGSGEMQFEHWLEMHTKVLTDFDENGEPHTRQIVCTPEFQEKLLTALQKWERDPEKVAAMKAVMVKQKEAYDAREARRRMVD